MTLKSFGRPNLRPGGQQSLPRAPVLRLLVLKIATVCLSLAWFTLPATASIQPIFSFTNPPANPYGSLVQGQDGNFYGTSYNGGSTGNGTIFRTTTNGAWTIIHSFTATIFGGIVFGGGGGDVYTNADGANPYAGLVMGPDGNFYGTTYSGGSSGNGTVFEVTTNGVLTTLHSFSATVYNGSGAQTNTDGANPHGGLIVGPDGNFYGTTSKAGGGANGTVFELTTNGLLTTLHSFSATILYEEYFTNLNGEGVNDLYTNLDGANPQGLTLGPDGNFYGTTAGGGGSGSGTVFELTTNGPLTTLYSFSAMESVEVLSGMVDGFINTNSDGANPGAGLTLGADGNFYGTTRNGGTNGIGTVFQITTNGALTTLCSFSGMAYDNITGNITVYTNLYGANPQGALVPAPDGSFYGTAYSGGTNVYGTVFQVTTNGTLTTLANFGNTNGAYLVAGLALGSDGNLYGTTSGGGSIGNGTVFQVTTNGALTTLLSFANTHGAKPRAGLTLGPDGKFYDTTYSGGSNANGTVFGVTTNGELTTLYSFGFANNAIGLGGNPNTNGADPYAGLALGADDNFYGTTYNGGTNGNGTVFQITTAGALTTLHSFSATVRLGFGSVYTNADGAVPYAGLTLGPEGNFYGTAYSGGSSGNGTVYEVTTNGAITKLHSFSATFYLGTGPNGGIYTNTDGAHPYAGLTLGTDGNLYGTTFSGGSGNGTVFVLTTNGALTTLVSFAETNGASPKGPLTLGPDGNFYGTTTAGGSGGSGTVFQMTTNGALTTLYSFSPAVNNGGAFGAALNTNADGASPYAGLTLGPDGSFYGTTYGGGPNGYGTVFEVTTNGALTTLVIFAITNGSSPYAGLTLGPDGNFYGTTYSGGSGGGGVIYSLNLPPSIITQPSNQTVAAGSNGTFTVTLFGTAPFAYQWLSNGTPIPDATNCALTIPDFTPSNVGNYAVIVTNTWGSVTSSVATIILPVLPTITNQPASESVPIGGTANFAVGAGGSPPLAFQWYFNTTTLLSGATNANLCFSPVLANQAGQYEVIVTSPFGSVTSSAAGLTVVLQPNCYGISNSGSGSVTLLLAGAPGSTNCLWTTTNLNLPLSQWQALSTNTADDTGLFWFTDTNAGNSPARFYILSSP